MCDSRVFWRRIFQEWQGNTNAVVLINMHLELPLQYLSPMLEDVDSAGAGAVNGYRD